MINLKKLYEDAVVGAAGVGDASAATGIVSGNSSTADIVNVGIDTEEVLGKVDPEKGFMGKDDFHIPTNVFGKTCKRLEIPSKKKKNLKNPYIKNMKVLENEEFENIINNINEVDIISFIQNEYNYKPTNVKYIVFSPKYNLFFIFFNKDKQLSCVPAIINDRFEMSDSIERIILHKNNITKFYPDFLKQKVKCVWKGN